MAASKATAPPVQVNSMVLDQITTVYKSNPIVSGAVNMLKSKITQAGIDVIVRSGSSKLFLNRKDALTKKFIDIELVPLIDNIVLHWILYGFVTVRAAPSQNVFEKDGKPFPTLVIVPHSQVYHMIYWNQFNQMTIKAFSRFGNMGTTPAEIPLCQVSSIYPPDPKGNPQSPLALSLRRLSYVERIWRYYLEASFRRVNPLLIFREDERRNGAAGKDGVETPTASTRIVVSGNMGFMGSADAENTSLRRQLQRRYRAIESFKMQIQESTFNAKMTAMKAQSDSVTDYDDTPKDVNTKEILAYENAPVVRNTPLFAPPGMSLERTPEIVSPEDPTKTIENINVEFYRSMGLLPITGFEGGERSSTASSVLIQDTIRDTTSTIQKLASTELSKVLTIILGPDITDQIFAQVIAKQSNGSVDKANLFGLVDRDGVPLSKGPVSAFDGGYTISMTESGAPYIIPRDAFGITQRSFGDTIDLEVKFSPSPGVSYEEIFQFYEMGVITEEATQKICARKAGIPESYLRPNMAAWRKQQMELQHPKKEEGKKSPKKQKTR
jgi:hypothetical protein